MWLLWHRCLHNRIYVYYWFWSHTHAPAQFEFRSCITSTSIRYSHTQTDSRTLLSMCPIVCKAAEHSNDMRTQANLVPHDPGEYGAPITKMRTPSITFHLHKQIRAPIPNSIDACECVRVFAHIHIVHQPAFCIYHVNAGRVCGYTDKCVSAAI